MKIKQSKGYSDTVHTEVLEPLTLEDFIIEEEAPVFTEYSRRWSTSLTLILKDEVAEHIAPLLADPVWRATHGSGRDRWQDDARDNSTRRVQRRPFTRCLPTGRRGRPGAGRCPGPHQ